MFQKNNIAVSEIDLIKLFFKGKNFPKKQNPSVKFFKFIMFALSKDSDQQFIDFMRNIKEKIYKNIEKNGTQESKFEKRISFTDETIGYNEYK